MTNSPPPDPRSSQTTPLGFDEFIGIFVAFTTIGAILFWSLSRGDEGFNITGILAPSPSPSVQPTPTPLPQATASDVQPTPTPLPQATASPARVSPVPTVVPTQSPEVLTPVPFQIPTRQRVPVVVPLPTTTPTPTPLPPATQAPPPATPTPPQPVNFVDVPKDFWARPFIDALSASGVVSGFAGDYFRPNQPVTRAEFAAILQDAFNQNPGQSATVFKDVPSNFWAATAVDRATETGFLRGYPGNVFQPQQQIPRAQVLVALASGLKLAPPSSPIQVLQFYKDANQIPNYATEKIATATTAGLVVNHPDPNLLNPNRNATRAEVAAIIHQALVQAGKAKPIQSQYIVQSR